MSGSSKTQRPKHQPPLREEKQCKRHRDYEREGRKRKYKRRRDDDSDHSTTWVEKNIDLDAETQGISTTAASETFELTSSVIPVPSPDCHLTSVTPQELLKREDWMLPPPSESNLPGSEVRASYDISSVDNDGNASTDRSFSGSVDFFSSLGAESKRKKRHSDHTGPEKELNVNLDEIDHDYTSAPPKAGIPGGPGSKWRMMRLRRVYETAEEEGLSLEQVALERFGSLKNFQEAKEERRILDQWERDGAHLSRSSHRREGVESNHEKQLVFTAVGASSSNLSYRRPGGIFPSMPMSGITQSNYQDPDSNLPNRAASLSHTHTPIPSVKMPSVRKQEKVNRLRHKTRSDNADDTTTIREMLRQERFGAGIADQKNFDAQFAQAIMGDRKFENDLEYIDDNSEKLGRRKMRSDAMKRQFAIHDYKRTQSVMANCQFCFGENDSPPKAPVIAMGTRVYLSCTLHEELVQGHCLIVPIQHYLNMLEGDTDVWDETQNFMKCLIHMYAEEGKGVIFYETVISFKRQKHTFIECLPLPWAQYEEIPIYFKESILQSEGEWSQHKKLIDFSARPGGFRRVMVPNLPYFMVQFDYKGENGYGHVIEGGDDDVAGERDGGFIEGMNVGGFPRYFAAEIIGKQLEIEPRRWRRPRQLDIQSNKGRVLRFKSKYDRFDWTGMIGH